MARGNVKDLLVKLFGGICFITRLKWREILERRHRKKESKRKNERKDTNRKNNKKTKGSDKLTYHHIIERSMSYADNRSETIENGALLSAENHRWFNKQSASEQAEMDRSFQEYKISILKKNNMLDQFGFFPTPSKKFIEKVKKEKKRKKGYLILTTEESLNTGVNNDKPIIINSKDDYREVFTKKGNKFMKEEFTGKNYSRETDYKVEDLKEEKEYINKEEKEYINKEEKEYTNKEKIENKKKSYKDKLRVEVNYNYEEYKEYIDEGRLEGTIGEKLGDNNILGEIK